MNGHFERIKEYIGDGNETVFAPCNIKGWIPVDSHSIAKQIWEDIESFPLAFIPEALRPDTRSTPFKSFIVTQEARATALPGLKVLANREDVGKYETFHTLSIGKLRNRIRFTKSETLSTQNQSITDVSNIIDTLIKGILLQNATEEAEKQRQEEEEAQRVRAEIQRIRAHYIQELEDTQRALEAAQRELEARRREQGEMAARNLPPSLQPTVRRFEADSVGHWLDHVKKVYNAHGIDGDILDYVGQFLPAYLQPVHEAMQDKTWEEYKQELSGYCQSDSTPVTLRMRKLQMRKKPAESTVEFIIRVNAIAANEAGIGEKEKVKIIMEVMPCVVPPV